MDAPPHTTSEELLEAIGVHRDKQAFAELFSRFAPKLVGMVMARGAGRSQADEVAQDVLLTVWRKADRFDPRRASAEAWIYTITRNRWVDRVRREKRPKLDLLDPALVEDPTAPDRAIGLQRRADRLQRALATLPEEQAVVLRRTYFEHRTLREVAEELDLPLGTVKSRTRLALGRLRGALGDGEGSA